MSTAPVTCPTCDGTRTVTRIRGGQPYPEPCPDCAGGAW